MNHSISNRRAYAKLAIFFAILALAALLLLHFLSPEFDPAWRMVSEYALGDYNVVLLLMFTCWALSTWAITWVVKPLLNTRGGKIGWALLVISGLGMLAGGIFAIPHPLHGFAALMGLPTFCVASLLVTISLRKNDQLTDHISLWPAHLPWISLVLTGVAMGIMMSGLRKAGVDMSSGKPLETLPAGVTGVVGWVNRLLIIAYCFWNCYIARKLLR